MKKILIALILMFLMASPAWCVSEWDKTRPATTSQWTDWPAASVANNAAVDRLLANYREGMTISYSSATTVAVSAGEVMCSNSAGTVRKMRQNTSATNVTFTDIDTGAEGASATYYLYANCDADATTATFKVSLSPTAPDSVTSYRRLGSFYNDASSNITVGGITNDNNVYAPAIGAYTSKSSGVDYQALTDGFVVANCFNNGGVYSYGYTDSATSPTTVVAKCGVDNSSNTDCSMSFPVKKGNYYRASCATSTVAINFVPLSN